jgi:hypothetical protein
MDYINPKNHLYKIDFKSVRAALNLYYFFITGTKIQSSQISRDLSYYRTANKIFHAQDGDNLGKIRYDPKRGFSTYPAHDYKKQIGLMKKDQG